jgi:hypothetical protein
MPCEEPTKEYGEGRANGGKRLFIFSSIVAQYTERASKPRSRSRIQRGERGVSVTDDEKLELLRSVLARAYEKRQPFPLRLVQAVRDHLASRTPRKPIIESLNIIEKNKDAA